MEVESKRLELVRGKMAEERERERERERETERGRERGREREREGERELTVACERSSVNSRM